MSEKIKTFLFTIFLIVVFIVCFLIATLLSFISGIMTTKIRSFKHQTMREMQITVFIMNYNGMLYIKNCLDSIKNQTMKHETILLDNHSTDGSPQYASSEGIRVIQNPKNMYICYMQQQALDMCKTKYAAFCHIDCMPEKRWLEKLYSDAEKENAGAVEPTIVHPNGQILYGGLTRWFTPYIGKGERYPIAVSTAATLYRNLGLKMFPNSYLHYHDSTYASEVLKRNGWGLIHEKNCIVKHIGSHSGLTTLKWKMLSRFNQGRLILKFHKPYPNPLGICEEGGLMS